MDKSIVPTGNPNKGGLYKGKDEETSKAKRTTLLEKSNELFIESMSRPKTNIYDKQELLDSTLGYLEYCSQHAIMPSFLRLANWYGYSTRQLNNIIQKESETGIFLERVKETFKDNLEQASLIGVVNPVSAIFIMKARLGYVEATKHIIEPSESLLGTPKTVEEIEDYIDADIVEE